MDITSKNKLAASLPTNMRITSSIDYPEDGVAKVRGFSKDFGITLEYDYIDHPDEIYVETVSIDNNGKSATIPLQALKNLF
jgi:hypothetical protein